MSPVQQAWLAFALIPAALSAHRGWRWYRELQSDRAKPGPSSYPAGMALLVHVLGPATCYWAVWLLCGGALWLRFHFID